MLMVMMAVLTLAPLQWSTSHEPAAFLLAAMDHDIDQGDPSAEHHVLQHVADTHVHDPGDHDHVQSYLPPSAEAVNQLRADNAWRRHVYGYLPLSDDEDLKPPRV